MIRGLYDAASALDAAMQRQEVTAENLAQLSTPGYRGRNITFERFDTHLDKQNQLEAERSGVAVSKPYIDFSAGSIRQTGSPYHLAVDGDAFFALKGPSGTVYTRNGSFHVGPDGQLLSDGNFAVLGAGGPIKLPPDFQNMTVASDGGISADGNPVAQIQLTRFADPRQLKPVGANLFESTPAAGPQSADRGVVQGALEGTNVSPAGTMVEMIQSARYFEAAQRALRAIADAVQMNTRPS